jgi:RHS repeat-associated protein
MCKADVRLAAASLALNDTPVGYQPPKGPAMFISLSYNHLDDSVPASPPFFNVGTKWSLNVLSFVEDDPASAGTKVERVAAGGGKVSYPLESITFNGTTGEFGPEDQTQAVLKRVPASGTVTSYTLTFPDGTVHTYAKLDGASTYPRRVFLSSITDPQGNALTFTYDSMQLRLNSITDAAGRSTTFCYDPSGTTNCTSGTDKKIYRITDPFGRYATLSYTQDESWQNCTGGKLCKITDVVGIESMFQYDTADPTFISTLTTPYEVTTFRSGTESGDIRWVEIENNYGQVERVEYVPGAASGISASETIPSGITAVNSSYDKGNSFYWNGHAYASGGITKDMSGEVTAKDYTKARVTHWLKNERNLVTGIAESIKEPLENRVFFNYASQPAGNIVGTSDRPTKTARIMPGSSTQLWAKTYNAQGNVLTETDPLGRETKYTYYSGGIDLQTVEQKISSTPTYATIASFGTYTNHLPASSTDAAGKQTSYTYNGAGQLTQVTDPLSQVTKYQYDGSSRLQYVKKTIGGSDVTLLTLAYNGDDQVSSRTDSEGHVISYTYDDLDRVLTETFPDSTYNEYQYSLLDLGSFTDRLGHSTWFGHDGLRMLEDVTDELGNVTHFEYYEDKTLGSVKQYNNATHDPGDSSTYKRTYWDIDVQGRVTGMSIEPDGDGFGQSYDSAGRPSVRTDGLSQTKTLGYNAANEVTSITYGGEVNPTSDVTFAYDSWYPRRTSMTDGLGTTSWSYVAPGTTCSGGSTTNCGALQLASENGPFTSNDTISYVYDELGRLKSRTVGSDAETFTYDIHNRVTAHTNTLGTFNYTFNGQTQDPLTRTLGTTGVKLTYAYGNNSADRRLASITPSQLASMNTARSFTLTTNPVRVTAISEGALAASGWSGGTTARAWAYTYDNADKLTNGAITPSGGSATNYATGYDYAGSINSFEGTSGTVNRKNQLTALGARSLTYDIEGNATNDGVHANKFDAENRIVEVGLGGSNKMTFAYDGLGRRGKITSVIGGTTTESRLAWCSDGTLCQQRNSSDTVTRRYVAEGEVRPSGTNLVYLSDHLGNVRAVTNTSGALQWAADYKPYGSTYQTFGSTAPDFRFAGLLAEPNSGLYLSNTRAYDPTIGAWLSRDPIGIEGGANLYAYVGGNPISRLDRIGLKTEVYRRPTQINGPFSPLNALDINHYWIKTDKYEAGMGGPAAQIPGQGAPDMPFTKVHTKDHSGQSKASNAQQVKLPYEVDEQCVNERIRPGRELGRFVPGMNDCQSFVGGVLDQCRIDNRQTWEQAIDWLLAF